MAETINVSEIINPLPKQREFIEAVKRHTFTLFGGAAGPGKSYMLRWMLVLLLLGWAKRGHRKVRVGLFSEDYPTLQDRQISKMQVEMPRWLGQVKDTRADGLGFHLNESYGGGIIALRNLDDPSKYQSSEFAAIGVEELTKNEQSVFDLLRFRMRWTGIDDVKFLAATNPGSIGHHWVKRLWIDRDFPEELRDRAHEFAFVPALPRDNPYLSPSYLKELHSLPTQLRRAMEEGDWNAFAGQVFEEWRKDVHVVKPFTVPDYWFRWISNDPGFTDPGTWYWFAADEGGGIYLYREATFSEAECGKRVTYSEQAKRVQELTGDESIAYVVTGMDAFISNPENGKSYVDYYREGAPKLYPYKKPVHGAGARANMAATFHEYLKVYEGPDGKPTSKLKVFENCRKFIQTLPTLPADENKPEQVADCSIDHWYQGAGYGLQSWHAERSRPEEKVEKFKPMSMGAMFGTPRSLSRMEAEKRQMMGAFSHGGKR